MWLIICLKVGSVKVLNCIFMIGCSLFIVMLMVVLMMLDFVSGVLK